VAKAIAGLSRPLVFIVFCINVTSMPAPGRMHLPALVGHCRPGVCRRGGGTLPASLQRPRGRLSHPPGDEKPKKLVPPRHPSEAVP
jgi:hypothetical protein